MRNSILFVNDYPMDEARRRWLKGDYPGHHLWGMNIVADQGWSVEYSDALSRPFRFPIDRLPLRKHLQSTLEIVLSRPTQPNIYCGSFHILKPLALLKRIGALPHNLIAMIHHPVSRTSINEIALNTADALFFLNDFSWKSTIGAMPRLGHKSHVVGWCLDRVFYDRIAEQQAAAPSKLIVSAGKEHRDYDCLIQGVMMVDEPDLRVEIYCSEETKPSLRDDRVKVFARGLNGGTISYVDLTRRYSQAIAIAVPLRSLHRTLGLTSVFDAFAMRRALLVTQHPSIDAPIDSKRLGISTRPSCAEDWASAIRKVISEPKLAIEMGQNGRAYAEDVLSIEAYGSRLNQLFCKYWGHQAAAA
jgi:glycosyltransferase involved in cell wall biosynthesis